MNLRTPRRRISPRTRRRYRVIREFFRRALGSSSQPDIKISSSIAVNVTDLKRKIVGLEQQLNEVNKHCQNIACLDCTGTETESCLQADARHEESNCCVPTDLKHEIETIREHTESSSQRKLNSTETKFLYKSSNGQYGKSEESENHLGTQDVIGATQTQGMVYDYGEHVSKAKTKRSKLKGLSDYGAKLHKYRTRSVYENFASANSSSSFRSLINPRMHHSNPGYSGNPHDKKYLKQEYAEPIPLHFRKEKKYKDRAKWSKNDVYKESYEQKPNKISKQKHNRELDQDFIADIITRQYRPVKMFGRRQSDFSKISAPVCRDQEFSLREDIQEGTELCSCCYDGQRHRRRRSDVSEMRSICDTRLYSSKRHNRGKHRRAHVDMFNNSDVYDIIPVKEKSSPKTLRKFYENSMLPYAYYREVPPSPRTLRPRLNLKSQYNSDFEDYMDHVKHTFKKGSPYRRRCQRERVHLERDVTSVQVPNFIKEYPRKPRKHTTCQVEKQGLCQQDNATMSSLQYLPYANDQVNVTVDTIFNKTEEIKGEQTPVDKTDKALCEIKSILQSFVNEIKKETIASQCDKSDVSSKIGDNGMHLTNENSTKLNGSAIPNSRHHSINNFGVGCSASPYMSSFQNPCCYPVMPVCPMSYPMPMQNGYMMPSPSYTCTNCVNAAKEPTHSEHCCNKHTTTGCHTEMCHTETENLIKEIYKFVAQGPVRKKDHESSIDRHEAGKAEAKLLTSRSVGESSRNTNSKHDAKVGTPPLKYYSKSCEAIGSRINSEPYISATNASYSDTILEKLSLQVTQSTSATEMDTPTTEDKTKRKTFSNVLRSIGFLKKKKKDVIEELSESESVIDVEVKPRSPRASYRHSPYRQEIATYMMHDQEYYQPPPMPSNFRNPNDYQPDYNPPYNPGLPDYAQPPPIHDMFAPGAQYSRMREQATATPYPSKQRPSAPPFHTAYDNPYKHMQQPQVPLCLKEIEVKSIGTQSVRKMSIFRKIKKKMQAPADVQVEYSHNTCSTQTQATPAPPPRSFKKPLFNWKNLQAKATAEHGKLNTDPIKFSLKAEKELAAGDLKLRNAMVKKLFYKRNPFSPRNLIVRTLLGKDKSSYGDPQRTDNMSTVDFSGAALCKKRFKGIENFLKRVAFNLGNTESQTEVKIISCIPIDVTDLQQKITHLEKQLENATCALQSSPSQCPEKSCKFSKPSKFLKLNKPGKQSVNTAVIESNFPSFTSEAISCKSLDCNRRTSPACLEKKDMSNVSFVLTAFDTNTAPVILSKDNSKIFQGTDQAAKAVKQEFQPNINQNYSQKVQPNNMDHHYHTQPVKPNKLNHCCTPPGQFNNRDHYNSQEVTANNRDHYCPQEVTPNNRDHRYPHGVTLNNRNHYYPQEVTPNNKDHYYPQEVTPNNKDHYYPQEVTPNNRDHYFSQELTPNNSKDYYYSQEDKSNNRDHFCTQEVNSNNLDHYYTAPNICEPKINNQRKTLFKKKKKILKNKKGTSPCVYYAHTYSSPFIKSNLSEELPKYDRNNVMTRSYLAAMVSRQYKPEVLGDNTSLQSEFSSPICRDLQQHSEGTSPCESDIWSCCHGPFHNIDEQVDKQNTLQTYMLHQINQGSAFYDSNQYDLVPVKEKPVKIRKDLESPRKKELRPPHIDMKCWPENVRTKYRYHSLLPLPMTNYYTARTRPDYTNRDKLDSYGKKRPVTYYNRTEPTRILAKRRKEIYRRERSINIETSKSCSIDFGHVYTKKTCKKPKKVEHFQPIPVPKKNAECLTTAINNSECQTEMSTIEVNSADTKTEATLNQIKSILQSVLAEVKVSSQTKGLVIQSKPKKDAVVQKGPSCNDMQASSFMNSITYSPYAMNPYTYVTSCSRQMSPSQYCYPHAGMKYFHNFPVFIQNPGGRHMCSSCYRSSQVKPSGMKQATTTATNTEQVKEEHSKETEKLIKEIYKSMALTMDFPNKDTSISEYNEMVKSLHDFTTPIVLKTEPKKQPNIIKNVVQAVSELFMKKDMIETSDTFNSTVESKFPSQEASTRSHAVTSTDTEFRMRMDGREKYLRAMNKQPVVPEVEEKTFREAMVQNANSITESETSNSESDTSTTIVGQVQKDVPELKHKKGKDGLFTKMFQSVKLFKTKEKPKKRVELTESEEETTSDSDDYQTVYSQKIEEHLRHRSRPHNLPRRKTHSKISYNKTHQRDRSPEKKRSPYMEQEYRRYWDEKLMYHNNRPRYSSERLTPQKPPYYRTYEARTALVQPNTQISINEPRIFKKNDNEKNFKSASKGIAWFKKHKKGIHCGEQWKKFVLES